MRLRRAILDNFFVLTRDETFDEGFFLNSPSTFVVPAIVTSLTNNSLLHVVALVTTRLEFWWLPLTI